MSTKKTMSQSTMCRWHSKAVGTPEMVTPETLKLMVLLVEDGLVGEHVVDGGLVDEHVVVVLVDDHEVVALVGTASSLGMLDL